jgi:hypothetical protein
MTSDVWLTKVGNSVELRLEGVEVSRADDDTLTLAIGTRGVVLHATRGVALFAPSFAAGGTIANRLENRIQYLEVESYAVNESTVPTVVDAAVAHLQSL